MTEFARRPVRNKTENHSAKIRQPQVPFGHLMIVTFVFFHLSAMLLFAIPLDFAPLRLIRSVLSPYMLCIGMNETWDTFAPHPKDSEQFLKAIVITLRGRTEVYSFPRMEELSFVERYKKERYRKFVESVLCKDCSGLWPDIERAIARRNHEELDPPDRVILIRFDSPIDMKSGLLGEDAGAKATAISELSIHSGDLE